VSRRSVCSRKGWLVAVLVVMTVLVGCGDDEEPSASSGGQTTSTVPDTITLQAGINDPQDPNIAVTEFLPEAVTIAAGKSVEWRITGPEPHSVTFFPTGQQPPPPGSDESLFAPKPPTGPFDGKTLINSGLVPLGPAAPPPFKVTFPTAGKYTYYCVIHPLMTGTVTVVDAGGKVDAQSDVNSRADAEKARWLAEGQAAKKKLVDATPVVERAADGTSTYKVEMGATTEHTDVLAFNRPALDLKVGDRVTFVNNSQAPHTASFAGRTTLPQDPTSPAVEKAAPGPSPQTLNPTDFFNTGVLPPNAGAPGSIPPEPVRSFTFVVRTAGNYTYVCILHVPSGMGGSLKVA
jgi:plastocyanin